MQVSGEEVIADLDATLDQLIENAKTLRQIERHSGFEEEIDALQKTQESLLARLCYRQQQINEQKKSNIDQKLQRLSKLSNDCMQQFSDRYCSSTMRRPIRISRRRQRKNLSH